MADRLTQEQIFALGALIHQKDNNRVVWDGATWVGVCRKGHVCASWVPFASCLEGECTEPYVELPDQDALLAAMRVGGYPAVVSAACDMLGIKEA